MSEYTCYAILCEHFNKNLMYAEPIYSQMIMIMMMMRQKSIIHLKLHFLTLNPFDHKITPEAKYCAIGKLSQECMILNVTVIFHMRNKYNQCIYY
jgi:hypothetical protein